MTEIKKIAVLGSGQMGHGIAQVAAQLGKYEVAMYDIQLGLVEKGISKIQKSLVNLNVKGQITKEEMSETLDRIKGTLDLNEAVSDSDLIIEAVTENASIKKNLFHEINNLIPAETIVATNTSSISITELSSAIEQPQRFCGMHFFNPPQINRLVEK